MRGVLEAGHDAFQVRGGDQPLLLTGHLGLPAGLAPEVGDMRLQHLHTAQDIGYGAGRGIGLAFGCGIGLDLVRGLAVHLCCGL
ncbi:hypothetical protein Sp245p_00080 [Azospirillum baldaniorum]|nr:hypothetical protein Sp245p_00080 [Azospirillum baldaniorum]